MSEPRITDKTTLLAELDRTWTALNAGLAHMTEGQLTTPTDAQGWTGKDHLVHLAMWERSVVYFLQGKPRHEGLGVGEATYLTQTEDEINALIQLQYKDLPLQDVLTLLRLTHEQLMTLLAPLTDADLNRPYRHFLPDEPGEGDGPPAMEVIVGNTVYHYPEHLEWIEKVVS